MDRFYPQSPVLSYWTPKPSQKQLLRVGGLFKAAGVATWCREINFPLLYDTSRSTFCLHKETADLSPHCFRIVDLGMSKQKQTLLWLRKLLYFSTGQANKQITKHAYDTGKWEYCTVIYMLDNFREQ